MAARIQRISPSCIVTFEGSTTVREGAFGTVTLGFLRKEKEGREISKIPVAVKKLHSPIRTESYKKLGAIAQLKHPNLVQLIGVVDNDANPQLILEFIDGKHLLEYATWSLPTEERMLRIALDIVTGMEYIHVKGCLHGALGARNVLIDAEGKCKVADFGLTQILEVRGVNYWIEAGVGVIGLRWSPPEYFTAGSGLTREADVWAFGVVLWELASMGLIPYGAECTYRQAGEKIANGSNPLQDKRLDNCPTSVIILMESVFKVDPAQRPTFGDLLKVAELLEEKVPHITGKQRARRLPRSQEPVRTMAPVNPEQQPAEQKAARHRQRSARQNGPRNQLQPVQVIVNPGCVQTDRNLEEQVRQLQEKVRDFEMAKAEPTPVQAAVQFGVGASVQPQPQRVSSGPPLAGSTWVPGAGAQLGRTSRAVPEAELGQWNPFQNL